MTRKIVHKRKSFTISVWVIRYKAKKSGDSHFKFPSRPDPPIDIFFLFHIFEVMAIWVFPYWHVISLPLCFSLETKICGYFYLFITNLFRYRCRKENKYIVRSIWMRGWKKKMDTKRPHSDLYLWTIFQYINHFADLYILHTLLFLSCSNRDWPQLNWRVYYLEVMILHKSSTYNSHLVTVTNLQNYFLKLFVVFRFAFKNISRKWKVWIMKFLCIFDHSLY